MRIFSQKNRLSDIEELAALLGDLVSRSRDFESGGLSIHVVASPAAGALSDSGLVRENITTLRTILLDAAQDTLPNPDAVVNIHMGEYPGHPARIARDIAASIGAEARGGKRYVVLTMGGDGTHLEILSALIAIPERLRGRVTVFRLPLGTGNDGADADSVAGAARIFLEGGRRGEIPAIRVRPRDMEPFYSFNIASVGIDAYVTRITNRLKGRLPGDAYKLIADVSTLFYEGLYGVRHMKIDIGGDGTGPARIEGRYILAAFGVTGRRSYGDHKRILPDDNNLCAILTRPLGEKLALKPLLYEGRHIEAAGVESRKAERITISYPGRICIQTDGEARVLEPGNFPCELEIFVSGLGTLQGKT